MLGKSLPTVTPQHGLHFLGEKSVSGFWKGQGEEGLVQEVWGRTYTSSTNQNCMNSMYSQGQKHLQTQWKAEGDRTSGRTGSLPGQTQLLKEHPTCVGRSQDGVAPAGCRLKSTLHCSRNPGSGYLSTLETLTPVKRICIIILCYIKASNSKGKKKN